jgi:hypothetical protein
MRKLVFVTLVFASTMIQGCSIFSPYLTPPAPTDKFEESVESLHKVQKSLNCMVREQSYIGGVSGFLTFVGFAGAGISAVFHASLASILAFTSAGATSLAFGGLYANSPRVAIYNAGLDAVACINDAINPLIQHHIELRAIAVKIQRSEVAVRAYIDQGHTKPDPRPTLFRSARTKANIEQKLAWLNGRAPSIATATSRVVSSVNDQLRKVVPDAAALARAGSSLNGQILAGVPARQGNKDTSVRVLANDDDSTLSMLLDNLQADINKATDVIEAEIPFPPISCKVAEVPLVKPIQVILSGNQTEITYPAAGTTLRYPVEGGTPPYTGIVWIGAEPDCLKAVIHSPNILHISPIKACTSTQTYTFDIYDSHGQHMAQPLLIKIS